MRYKRICAGSLHSLLALLICGTSIAQTAASHANEYGGRTIRLPASPTIQDRVEYYDSTNRLRRTETIYSRQYAELDGLSTQIVEHGLNPGSRVVTNTYSASSALSSGVQKTVTEFRNDKRVRRVEFPPILLSQRTGLSKKTTDYDPSGKVVRVENLVTTTYAESKGYDRIIFYYERKSAPDPLLRNQASREERRYIKTPVNQTGLTKLVIFYNLRGQMTTDEQYFLPPFASSNGAKLIVSHYRSNGKMTLQEHYYPEEFVKRMGVDLTKMYFDEQEATTRVEYFRNKKVVKTESK